MTAPDNPATDRSFAAPTSAALTTGGAGDAAADVGGRFAEGLARVAALEDRPLAEHADAYQHLHADLQAVLADVDSA